MIVNTLSQLICFIYNVITAKIDSDMEKEDLKDHTQGSIKHGWWGGAYLVLIGVAFGMEYLIYGNWNYFLIPALMIERKIVFDISYNLFQPRNIFFVDPKSKSIVDQIYNWIFRNNAKVYQIVNLVICVILQYFIYKK